MPIRGSVAAAVLLTLGQQAAVAGERLRHASCTLMRFYVAKYSEAAAETWARSHGATDTEIEAARKCLVGANMQTASVTAK